MATIRRKMGQLGHWPKTLRNSGTTALDLKGLFDPLIGVTENDSFRPGCHVPVCRPPPYRRQRGVAEHTHWSNMATSDVAETLASCHPDFGYNVAPVPSQRPSMMRVDEVGSEGEEPRQWSQVEPSSTEARWTVGPLTHVSHREAATMSWDLWLKQAKGVARCQTQPNPRLVQWCLSGDTP